MLLTICLHCLHGQKHLIYTASIQINNLKSVEGHCILLLFVILYIYYLKINDKSIWKYSCGDADVDVQFTCRCSIILVLL